METTRVIIWLIGLASTLTKSLWPSKQSLSPKPSIGFVDGATRTHRTGAQS